MSSYNINKDPDFIEARSNTRLFEIVRYTINYIWNDIRNGEIDLDPPHQRNVITEGDKNEWQSNIIYSHIYGPQVAESEFDTIFNNDGQSILRSLDGKQRLMALIDYRNDKFKYMLKKPAQMYKKKYSELKPSVANYFKNISIAIKICKSTLTNEEVTNFFEKKQIHKETTFGERLDARWYMPGVEWANDFIKNNSEICASLNLAKEIRKSKTELLVLISYLTGNDNYVDVSETKSKRSKLLEWLSTDIDSETYNPRIIEGFKLIASMKDMKRTKGEIIPIINLFLKNDTRVSEFIRSNYSSEFYDHISGGTGQHNANKKAINERMKYIQEKYDEYVESS